MTTIDMNFDTTKQEYIKRGARDTKKKSLPAKRIKSPSMRGKPKNIGSFIGR